MVWETICSNGLHLPLNLEFTSSGSPLSISFSQNTEAVVLNEPLTIRCHVNTRLKEAELITRSSMNFYCPLMNKTTFCFQNCQMFTVCKENGRVSCQRVRGLGDVSCRIVRHEDWQLVYEYTVPRLTADWLASDDPNRGFSCASAGQSTRTIRLHQRRRLPDTDSMRPAPITTTSTVPPTVASISTTPVSTGLVASGSAGSAVRRNSQPPHTQKSPFVEYLDGNPLGRSQMGTITFIALIALALSVFINIFCCIRCVLIRQYISSDTRALMKSCFCMKKEIINGRASRGYSKHSPPNSSSPEAHWSTGYPASGGPCFHLLPDAALPDAANSDESFALDGRMQRVRPEGKANNSTISNSGGRSNSVSGISLVQPSVQLYTASGQPVVWAQPWPPSDPQTPSSLQPKHHRSSQVIGTPVLCLNTQYASQGRPQQPVYRGPSADPEAYDASQRSLIVSPTMMMLPGNRMSRVFAAQDMRPGVLQRASSKDTILSGLVIQPPPMLQELTALGPGSSVSEAVSEKTSSDLSGRKGPGPTGPVAVSGTTLLAQDGTLYPAYYQLSEGYGSASTAGVDRAHPMGASQPHLSSNMQQYVTAVGQSQAPNQVESRDRSEVDGQLNQQERPATMVICPSKTKELEAELVEKDIAGKDREQLRGPARMQSSPSPRLRQQWTKQWAKNADIPTGVDSGAVALSAEKAFLYCKTIPSNKLAESVNTEDELPSDWSDRDTALGTEKESHSSSAPHASADDTAVPLLPDPAD
nr:unnamed protein product [Spirometra erinaceieuropaei]